jgi:DNA-binding transcriptional LysR family regulator
LVVSLVQLQYFVAVAEEGNVGRAAQRLHICQPPLTRQIKNLEQELGTPLFQRTPKGMDLLPQGERLLSHARRILEQVEHARLDVARSALARPQGETRSHPRVVHRSTADE